VVVCDGIPQLEKYFEISKSLSNLKAIVMYGNDELTEEIKSKVAVAAYKFEDFLVLGQSIADSVLHSFIHLEPQDLRRL